ncbi:MAG: hypothetical protein B7Z18_03475 [Alishewanella sp. 32-51-5]|nr:MAG: hypothetical protein B7Z18_03475 [Alishewanella sp. 32-51-5]
MEVLKQISPVWVASAPNAVPSNTRPSSRARRAFFIKVAPLVIARRAGGARGKTGDGREYEEDGRKEAQKGAKKEGAGADVLVLDPSASHGRRGKMTNHEIRMSK